MTILFCSDSEPAEPWRLACARAFPRMAFRVWPDTGPAEAIRYALVWRQPSGLLAHLPNLKAILVLGAGVDSVLSDPELPGDVPVVRLVDAGLPGPMAEYALYAVLHFQRRMADYFEQQRAAIWRPREEFLARQWPVGVMGLGVIGATVAQRIAAQGYPVAGWSRNGKSVEGVEVYGGAAGLDRFLARTRVLVNVLPLTPQTSGILNTRTFAAMPCGGYIVNIGRGGHVVDADLIAALNSEQLAGGDAGCFRKGAVARYSSFLASSEGDRHAARSGADSRFRIRGTGRRKHQAAGARRAPAGTRGSRQRLLARLEGAMVWFVAFIPSGMWSAPEKQGVTSGFAA